MTDSSKIIDGKAFAEGLRARVATLAALGREHVGLAEI